MFLEGCGPRLEEEGNEEKQIGTDELKNQDCTIFVFVAVGVEKFWVTYIAAEEALDYSGDGGEVISRVPTTIVKR